MNSVSCEKQIHARFPILAFSHYLIRLISLYRGVSGLYLRYVLRALLARERLLALGVAYHERAPESAVPQAALSPFPRPLFFFTLQSANDRTRCAILL